MVIIPASLHLIDHHSRLNLAPSSPYPPSHPPSLFVSHAITYCALQSGENTCFDSYDN